MFIRIFTPENKRQLSKTTSMNLLGLNHILKKEEIPKESLDFNGKEVKIIQEIFKKEQLLLFKNDDNPVIREFCLGLLTNNVYYSNEHYLLIYHNSGLPDSVSKINILLD